MMKKSMILGLTIVVLGICGTYAINYFQLQSPLNSAIKSDPRNNGIDVSAHYGSYMNPSTLVFDLNKVSGSNSSADVFRVLLQFAERMKEKRFDDVELAYKGKTKFKIEGSFFRTLGKEYGSQNVIYTIRTFPENLKTPAGSRAYPEWSGGWLGVMNKQMEDFSDFHKQWYLSEQ
jgi:hypothetical protein